MAFLEEIMENNESDLRDELKGVDKNDDKDDDMDDVKDDDEVSSVALVDEGSRCKMAVRV